MDMRCRRVHGLLAAKRQAMRTAWPAHRSQILQPAIRLGAILAACLALARGTDKPPKSFVTTANQ